MNLDQFISFAKTAIPNDFPYNRYNKYKLRSESLSIDYFSPLKSRQWFLDQPSYIEDITSALHSDNFEDDAPFKTVGFEDNDLPYVTYELREFYIKHFGYCIHTQESIKQLSEIINGYIFKPKVIDIGCGTGYLTNYLIEQGVNCIGIDDFCKSYGFNQSRLNIKNFIKDDAVKYIANFNKKYNVYFMSWACNKSHHALEILKHIPSGSLFIFTGDVEICATPSFYDYLRTHFNYMEYHSDLMNSKHIQFKMINDKYFIYLKK